MRSRLNEIHNTICIKFPRPGPGPGLVSVCTCYVDATLHGMFDKVVAISILHHRLCSVFRNQSSSHCLLVEASEWSSCRLNPYGWYSILSPPQRRNSAKLITPLTMTECSVLDLDCRLQSLLLLLNTRVGLGTHDATTPLPSGALAAGHVTILDSANELGKLVLILGADLGKS